MANSKLLLNLVLIKLFILYKTDLVVSQDNNVCGSFKDYYTVKTNDRCWYDVAAEGSLSEIIQANGYPFEQHKVATEDGYILSIFRIPNTEHPNPNVHPVFLQHGLIAHAGSYLGLGNNSLPFVLSDNGYDVWLGNYRGTKYSEEHVNLNVKDKRFWDHGVDELALKDIPAMLNYIVNKTDRKGKILYVGHSLGTTLAMMYGSAMPEEAKENVKLFLLMAPAHKLTHMISPIRTFMPFAETILEFIREYDLERFVSQASSQQGLLKMFCEENPKVMQLCMQLFNQFYGPLTQMGTEIVPVFLNLLPGGSSIKVVKHVSDFIGDKFQKYDFGPRNREIYGQVLPPQYNVNNIEVPVYVMYSINDWATTKEDAINFYSSLKKRSRFGLYEVGLEFNHQDFLFGRYAKKFVYNQILKVFDRVIKST